MQFTVTADDVIAAATNTTNTKNEVVAEIAQMQNYVAGLMDIYQGTAASTLANVSLQWSGDSKALSEVLSTIAANLQSNAHNYTLNETTNANNMSNVIANLPAAQF
jgi:WXG100 family type VII secretion target